MFTLIHESGFAAWVTLILTVAGAAAITTIGRKRRRPGSVAAAWAVAVLAAGALGFATGQRKVDQGVRGMFHHQPAAEPAAATAAPPPDGRRAVQMMSVGTREASGNLILAGAGALLLCFTGGVMALFVREPSA
jgi:hypothetical protein